MNQTPPSATEIAMIAATVAGGSSRNYVNHIELNAGLALDIWLQAARTLRMRRKEVEEVFYDNGDAPTRT